MISEPSTSPSVTSWRSRAWRVAVGSVLAAGLLYVAAVGLVSRPAFQAALRDRIERLLRARVGEVAVGPDVHVDPLFCVTFGPVTIPGTHPADPPVIRIARVRVRARLWALLAGRAEPASVRLQDVRVEAGTGGEALRELATRLPRRAPHRVAAAAIARTLPDDAADDRGEDPLLSVQDLSVHLPVGGRDLDLGPVDATIRRERADGAERVAGEILVPGGGRGVFSVRRDGSGWTGEALLGGVRPAALPAALRDCAVTLEQGSLSLDVSAEVPLDLSRARVRGRVTATDLVLAGKRLGADPVGPLAVSASGAVDWDGADRRVTVRDGTVTLPGGLAVAVAGDARLGPGVPFSLTVRADGVDFAAVVAALPPSLALPEDAPRPGGTLDARFELAGPLLAPAAWTVQASLDLARMREETRRAPPAALRAPFVFHPEVERGTARAIVVGPRSPDFVPVSELPVHVVRAVTASEDGGFFAHEGFDFQELRNAFAAGAEKGRVVRGGSTITQQLAKNLYLSREKTLARKVREAALTIALEATVPKHRLLEIYLNVAEWGPGIWGIGPAARHWFGKDARELTPKEAAFLATVIPNPVRYHVMWDRGTLSEAWEQRVDELLLKMLEQGAITDDALATALREPVVFARPDALARP
ncbi:transglycosylase domain-containing protein [Anaeromyxobacter oryzae]|uniref:Glycosyl transferase family 51 domain-containing protein n=1 Tax=Anaeromyxobacter oryzae TaxID=2918170 RepID=A0ABN6MZP3_9BACT|nr:biosynthetic peptidoglycan transglycosylase [Anaeromyxobacter oryzae]BDG06136.1 hypothetical protein AMOR_51320 [Anaeromyxobacter oryzae]